MLWKILFILLITAMAVVDLVMQFKVMDKEEHPTELGFQFNVLNFLFIVFYYITIVSLIIP